MNINWIEVLAIVSGIVAIFSAMKWISNKYDERKHKFDWKEIPLTQCHTRLICEIYERIKDGISHYPLITHAFIYNVTINGEKIDKVSRKKRKEYDSVDDAAYCTMAVIDSHTVVMHPTCKMPAEILNILNNSTERFNLWLAARECSTVNLGGLFIESGNTKWDNYRFMAAISDTDAQIVEIKGMYGNIFDMYDDVEK